MKTRLAPTPSSEPRPADFPDADELAMLRAWYAGMAIRKAAERYLPDRVGAGQSARGILGSGKFDKHLLQACSAARGQVGTFDAAFMRF